MTVLSMLLAVIILAALVLSGAVVLFELLSRVRDRWYSPEMQLKRAGLGKYPHWQA